MVGDRDLAVLRLGARVRKDGAIVGTFGVMYLLGYSLDNLSMMALILSVGFVVDDAIVMLENIVRHMERGEDRRTAALLLTTPIGAVCLGCPELLIGAALGPRWLEAAPLLRRSRLGTTTERAPKLL